jgi:hypothetical protein
MQPQIPSWALIQASTEYQKKHNASVAKDEEFDEILDDLLGKSDADIIAEVSAVEENHEPSLHHYKDARAYISEYITDKYSKANEFQDFDAFEDEF